MARARLRLPSPITIAKKKIYRVASNLYQKRFDAMSSVDALARQASRGVKGNWIDNSLLN